MKAKLMLTGSENLNLFQQFTRCIALFVAFSSMKNQHSTINNAKLSRVKFIKSYTKQFAGFATYGKMQIKITGYGTQINSYCRCRR
jgi:hypothetical protein